MLKEYIIIMRFADHQHFCITNYQIIYMNSLWIVQGVCLAAVAQISKVATLTLVTHNTVLSLHYKHIPCILHTQDLVPVYGWLLLPHNISIRFYKI